MTWRAKKFASAEKSVSLLASTIELGGPIMTFLDDHGDRAYALLRIVSGLLFLAHGVQKFFNFPTAFPYPLNPMLYAAGAIEIIAGALIVLGLFTRPAAFVASGMSRSDIGSPMARKVPIRSSIRARPSRSIASSSCSSRHAVRGYGASTARGRSRRGPMRRSFLGGIALGAVLALGSVAVATYGSRIGPSSSIYGLRTIISIISSGRITGPRRVR